VVRERGGGSRGRGGKLSVKRDRGSEQEYHAQKRQQIFGEKKRRDTSRKNNLLWRCRSREEFEGAGASFTSHIPQKKEKNARTARAAPARQYKFVRIFIVYGQER